MLFIAMLTIVSCQEKQNSIGSIPKETSEEGTKEASVEPSFLLSSSNFEAAFKEKVEQLIQKRSGLKKDIPVDALKANQGVLLVPSVEVFRPIYEKVVLIDSLWNENYDEAIESLVQKAFAEKELVAKLEGQDEVAWAIEDLLGAKRIDPDDIMDAIADQMPIKTLWSRIRDENAIWFEQNETLEEPKWDRLPEEQYQVDRYFQLFVNNKLVINILDTTRFVKSEKGSIGNGSKTIINEKNLIEASKKQYECYRFKSSKGDWSVGPTRMRTVAYISDWFIVSTVGASCKGWRRVRGRWRARRFRKELTMTAFVIAHSAGLKDPCDPAFGGWISQSKIKNRRSFRTFRNWWGLSYVAVLKNNFNAAVSRRGFKVQANL